MKQLDDKITDLEYTIVKLPLFFLQLIFPNSIDSIKPKNKH